MGKKYLDTKKNTLEASILDVWEEAAKLNEYKTKLGEKRRVAGGAQSAEEQGNVTVNLRIDVSGVTDKTDKRQLAKEISAMVMKEVRAKMGGPLNTSGFSRSG